MQHALAKKYRLFINNHLGVSLEPTQKSKIKAIKLIIALFLFLTLVSILFELLTTPQTLSLVTKSVQLLIGWRFLSWYKGKTETKMVAALLVAYLFSSLAVAHFFTELNILFLFWFSAIPPLAFLLLNKSGGILWSFITIIWFIFTLYLQTDVESTGYFISIGSIVLISLISSTYSNIQNETEKEYASTNEELTRLIYIISHDLRTPLTSIKGFVSFLREDIAEHNAQQTEHDLGRTEQVIESMQKMINDLLDLSRIGRDLQDIETVDTRTIVNELLMENEALFAEKKIQVQMLGDFPQIKTHSRKFQETLRNLLSNAIKYIGTPEHPSIVIGAEDRTFEYQFYVKDNGVGIDPEYQDKIFDLFFQQPDSQGTERTNSSGVGLSVVKGFVKDMGGKVWVESEKDKGSKFVFTVPKQPPSIEGSN